MSVHSSRGGMPSVTPSAARRSRSGPLAATPPPIARRSAAAALQRALAALGERLDDRVLVARREVRRALARAVLAEVAHLVEQRGLHAREREVQPVEAARDREGERLRVAVAGELLERRAAGERQAEQARALVERLAGGVVERAAEDVEGRVVLDAREQRVAAAGEQADERRLEDDARRPSETAQEVRRDVALEVVDRRERQAARGGDRLRGRDADEQRADEPRPLRDADERDVVERRAGAAQRVVDRGVGELEVVARGDLRHDAAVGVVDALRGDDVRQHVAVAGDDRRARVVAARLDREDEVHQTGAGFGTSSKRPESVIGVRHMMTASSPLSW